MQDFPDKSPPAFLRPFGSKRQSRAIAVPRWAGDSKGEHLSEGERLYQRRTGTGRAREPMEQREQSQTACRLSYAESRQRKAAIKREQCQTRLSTAEREQARPKVKAKPSTGALR